MIGQGNSNNEILQDLLKEEQHESFLYPDTTAEVLTLTAGAVINTFGDWAQLIPAISEAVYISSINVETASVIDKAYMVELSYGADKTIITRFRTRVSLANIGFIKVASVRADVVPKGEIIYYRMMCETGLATLTGHARYFYNS